MLVGRDAERARIGALLEAARASRSGALVIRGEPGIGKTALLEDARAHAGDMCVIEAHGLESESDLPFAGLHQLLRPALDLLERLPGPQAAALRGALGLAPGAGENRFLVSAACLTLLAELAEQRPALCLVDDGHWLDTPSADALLFVARRLGAEGIAMVFTAREGESERFDARDLPQLILGRLDAASSSSLLTSRVVGALDTRVRELLLDRAQGNALALVELPRALTPSQLAGTEALPEALPLARDVKDLFLARARRLPEATQRLLVLLAADDTGILAPVLAAASALGLPDDAIDLAESARLVEVQGSRVAFEHPLVRSSVYQTASSGERRAAHLALAEALGGELEADQRAWHRAAAATGPNAEIAHELEAAAETARLRGGPAAAARALERAAMLSTDSESQARRLVLAAREAWHAGQLVSTLTLLDRASPFATDWEVRAELDHVRGQTELWSSTLAHAYETLHTGAARVAAFDPRRALEMLLDAAIAAIQMGDYARVSASGASVLALAESLSDEEDRRLVAILVAVANLHQGSTAADLPDVLDVLVEAHEFADPRWIIFASGAAQAAGEEARSLELLRLAIALARESAHFEHLTRALASLVLDEMIVGRQLVVAEASEGLELSTEAGIRNTESLFHAALAWFAAARGESDECRAHALEAAEQARANGNGLANAIADWALSLLDLNAGRPKEAAIRLEGVLAASPGVGHPYVALLAIPDYVEAAVRTGGHELAQAAFAPLDAFAHSEAPSWAQALAMRCRAILSSGNDAEHEFRAALRLHRDRGRRLDRARTALLYGEFLRRQRRRTDAREQLHFALDEFERLGAEAWSQRTRSELRASGETARKRDPSTIDQLTPQELQIARFVAEGLSNKEVAAQLFLSPRTIDYHLRNIFSKLGITSRTQLARLDLGEERVAVAARAAVASS